jgi:site-specific recombinase XerD
MIDAFIAWLRSADGRRPLTATTLRDYERHLTRFRTWLTDALGLGWSADVISEHRMAAYLQHLQETLKRAPATQHKAVVVLRVFGAWLVETNQRCDNPARTLRAQPEQLSPPKALTPRVIQRVVDAAYHTGDLRDAVVIELLASSGMRASEVASIQIEQLERGERTMWVRITGKGAKVRRLPLPKHGGLLIDQYLAARSSYAGERPRTGPLLLGQRGGITRTTINDIVAKVVSRATLTPTQRQQVTPHAFRHTVATALVRRRDLVTAADVLGHTNINTTRRYAKASAAELEAAINEVATGLRSHTEESE